MDVFKLSRNWFNWCFDNPDKISPNHSALYFFCIEHCNRLGWKEKFGLPTEMTKEAIGIKNYRTYTNTLNDLVSWGFISLIQKSKNQYSSNIIAIVNNTKAPTKALDKALQKHSQKHCKSIVSINIQETKEQETKEQIYEVEKTTSLFKQCISLYNDFCLNSLNVPMLMDGVDGKAMKAIIIKLKSACIEKTDENIIEAWKIILDNYEKWDNFHKGQIKISQINSNLLNIINNIKNGSSKQNTKKDNDNRLDDAIKAFRQMSGD